MDFEIVKGTVDHDTLEFTKKLTKQLTGLIKLTYRLQSFVVELKISILLIAKPTIGQDPEPGLIHVPLS
jgi:hypothetical protein